MTTRQAPVTNETVSARESGGLPITAARLMIDHTTGRAVFSTTALAGDAEAFLVADGNSVLHLNSSAAGRRTAALFGAATVMI